MDNFQDSNQVKQEYHSDKSNYEQFSQQDNLSDQLKLQEQEKYYPFLILPKSQHRKTSFVDSKLTLNCHSKNCIQRKRQNNFTRQEPKERQSSIQKRKLNTNHWTTYQKNLYCIFVIHFKTYLNQQKTRRLTKIFKCMEDFVKTRNSNQCRSHHQKQLKHAKQNDIQSLISLLKQKNMNWQQTLKKRNLELKSIQNKLNCVKNQSFGLKKQYLTQQSVQFKEKKNCFKEIFDKTFNTSVSFHKPSISYQKREIKQKDIYLPATSLYYQENQIKEQSQHQKRPMFRQFIFQAENNMENVEINNFNQFLYQKEMFYQTQKQIQMVTKINEKVFYDFRQKIHKNNDQLALQIHYHMMMWALLSQQKNRRQK